MITQPNYNKNDKNHYKSTVAHSGHAWTRSRQIKKDRACLKKLRQITKDRSY